MKISVYVYVRVSVCVCASLHLDHNFLSFFPCLLFNEPLHMLNLCVCVCVCEGVCVYASKRG